MLLISKINQDKNRLADINIVEDLFPVRYKISVGFKRRYSSSEAGETVSTVPPENIDNDYFTLNILIDLEKSLPVKRAI